MTDYNEILLEAIQTVVSGNLSKLAFNKTIVATITDISKANQGEYQVNDGTTTFTAFSEDTSYEKDTKVSVLIPNGDFSGQKTILGRYVVKEGNFAYIYRKPWSKYVGITNNLLPSHEATSLRANGNEEKKIILENVSVNNGAGYSTLGIKADFKTLLKSTVAGGEYGIKIAIGYIDADEVKKASTFTLSSNEMIGDPYNFESYYNQQKLIDISRIKKIEAITVALYQDGNFVDKTGTKLEPKSFEDDIFVKNIYISLGYNTQEYDSDQVLLYTLDSPIYGKKYADGPENTKVLHIRWVHIDENNNIIVYESPTALAEGFTLNWYVYNADMGDAAEDSVAGPFWEKLGPAINTFEQTINCYDYADKGSLTYKVVITDSENNKNYTSEPLTLQNEVLATELKASDVAQALGLTVMQVDPEESTDENIKYLKYWDGKLKLDGENDTILSTAMAAGRKSKDEKFTGLVLGSLSNTTTGLFGYQDNKQSFGFNTNGTAFIGTSSAGRIEFDGNNSIIKSASYCSDTSTGMLIDLAQGMINMKGVDPTTGSATGSYITLSTISPYFMITDKNFKNLINISDDEYYFQSANFMRDSTNNNYQGLRFDLLNGELLGYNFTLNNYNTKQTEIVKSNGFCIDNYYIFFPEEFFETTTKTKYGWNSDTHLLWQLQLILNNTLDSNIDYSEYTESQWLDCILGGSSAEYEVTESYLCSKSGSSFVPLVSSYETIFINEASLENFTFEIFEGENKFVPTGQFYSEARTKTVTDPFMIYVENLNNETYRVYRYNAGQSGSFSREVLEESDITLNSKEITTGFQLTGKRLVLDSKQTSYPLRIRKLDSESNKEKDVFTVNWEGAVKGKYFNTINPDGITGYKKNPGVFLGDKGLSVGGNRFYVDTQGNIHGAFFDGIVNASQIDGKIKRAQINNSAISTDQLASSAITNVKIAANTIEATKISNSYVDGIFEVSAAAMQTGHSDDNLYNLDTKRTHKYRVRVLNGLIVACKNIDNE